MSDEEKQLQIKEIHERQSNVILRLDGQDRVLQEIRAALVGNDALGQKGLVKRIEHVENHVTSMENLRLKIVGGVLALSAAGSALGSKLIALIDGGHK